VGERTNQVTGDAAWSDPAEDIVVYEVSSVGLTGDPEVDALVDDIEYTRTEMTDTVEQIGDRLDPKNIVAQAKGSVRDATIGKVEDMATTAGDMVANAGQTAQQAGTGIVDTIRRNPLPAALIGIGAAWLAMSNRNSSGFRSSDWSEGGRYPGGSSTWDTTGARRFASDRYGSGGSGVTDRIGQIAGDKASQVQDTAGQIADQVQGTAGELADQFQSKASQVPNVARQVQDNASRVVQENPLAVGAIAMAVGTAVGMALPATRPEREYMGQARDSLIGRAENVASDAMNKVEESARQR
jgi:ElaB/YqjD/DUF883 family membrane-anchored ribosome-binding protein